MKILVTGCAGFIGYHLCNKLLDTTNNNIYGIDNLNSHYDVNLKISRLNKLKENKKFNFYKIDLTNESSISKNFKKNKYDIVINLAAQAGVRYSIKDPKAYFKSNINGFFNILNESNNINVKHLIYASTSSVYGDNNLFPTNEEANTDKPLSFYAASKKTNEVLAYSYSNIYSLPTTGLRFFTVYGPLGRPDMSLFKFTKNTIELKKIELYNNGDHQRDFTYIDDIVISIEKLLSKPSKNKIPYQIFNIGSNNPQELKYFLKIINTALKIKSKIKKLPLQKGDVKKSHADTSKLEKHIKFKPKTNIKAGIMKFISWYKDYYK